MTDADTGPPDRRVFRRREPPPLIEATVVERVERSPRMLRVTLEGAGLDELLVEPAASVRLLVPSPGTTELVLPVWNGNEFLLPGGVRPALRTFTPRRADPAHDRLDLEIVRHPGGAVSEWAERCGAGSPVAVSGPGRGYEIDAGASTFVLLGDETALPAIAQLLEVLAPSVTVVAHMEVVSEEARLPLPEHPGATLTWHVRAPDAAPGTPLIAAAAALDDIDPTTRIWAAGEAASMQAIRTLLFTERDVPRSQATIRGYWKPARG